MIRTVSLWLAIALLWVSSAPLAAQEEPAPAPAEAETAIEPSVRITEVDVTAFPDVALFLSRRGLDATLESLELSVSEDGTPREIGGRERADVGTQTALILDASGSVLLDGVTGVPRYREVGDVVRRLARLNVLSPQFDWLASYVPEPDGSVQALAEWSRDHQAVADSIYLFQPSADIEATALFDLLFAAMDSFGAVDVPQNVQQSIVVFSDGIDITSSLELNDAISRAEREFIQIHTVLLGPETDDGVRSLRRLATLTGGSYRQLDSIEALDDLWAAIGADRVQEVVRYRSLEPDPDEVAVEVTLADGSTLSDAARFPALDIQPVSVEILSPRPATTIQKEAPAFDSPLTELEPRLLDIQVQFEWPDGRPRALSEVEYTVNDDTRVIMDPPFDQLPFPIQALDSGNYTVRVRARDELGLVGESAPVPIRVAVERPAAPVPTEVPVVAPPVPLPAPVETVAPVPFSWVPIAALATGLLSLFAALIVLFVAARRPRRLRELTDVFAVKIKELTEPFFPEWVGRPLTGGGDEKAYLVVETGGADLPEVVTLRDANTRIGRDPGLSKVTINNRFVSRLHCRISEEGERIFRIWDEGSTSGTYVNREEVGMSGRILRPGDSISIGPVQLRFYDRLEDVDLEAKSEKDATWETEPWQPFTDEIAAEPDDFLNEDGEDTEPFAAWDDRAQG